MTTVILVPKEITDTDIFLVYKHHHSQTKSCSTLKDTLISALNPRPYTLSSSLHAFLSSSKKAQIRDKAVINGFFGFRISLRIRLEILQRMLVGFRVEGFGV